MCVKGRFGTLGFTQRVYLPKTKAISHLAFISFRFSLFTSTHIHFSPFSLLSFRRLYFHFTTLLCYDGSMYLALYQFLCCLPLQNNDQLALLFHCHSLTCGVEIEKVVVHFLSDNVTKIDLEAVNRRTRTKRQLHKNFKIFANNISPGAKGCDR